ncbi:MAG UNVERIFIED_CONTAM: hypothetical protein LVR18_18880 [Planctomycetaceae bacterium]
MSESAVVASSAVLPPGRRVSGRLIVASMFLLGICATSFLYTYWTLHLMPFMPLQESLVREFPGSRACASTAARRKCTNRRLLYCR